MIFIYVNNIMHL